MPDARRRSSPAEAAPYEHPARAAESCGRAQTVGRLFELHPSLVESGRAADSRSGSARWFRPLSAAKAKYTPIRRYPVERLRSLGDRGARELAGELEAKLASFAGPLLESIEFVRQYSGPPLAEGTKSVSFRLTVGSPERTLSSEEVGEIRARIIEGMRELGYELRV